LSQASPGGEASNQGGGGKRGGLPRLFAPKLLTEGKGGMGNVLGKKEKIGFALASKVRI